VRRVLIIIGAIVSVIVALVAYAYFNLNSIIAANRAYVLVRVSDALGRSVETGAIEARLGWGIEVDVHDAKIADDPAFASEPFLQAHDLYVRVEFLPLLARSFEITSLVIQRPQVRIIRNRAGVLNVSTMAKHSSSGANSNSQSVPGGSAAELPLSARSPNPDVTGSRAVARAAVSVRKFRLEDGAVDYADAKTGGPPVHLQHLNLGVSDFSLDSPFSMKLALAALGPHQDVAVGGKIGPLMQGGAINSSLIPLAVTATIGPIALARLRALPPIARLLPPELSIADPLALDGRINGTFGALQFNSAGDLGANHVIYRDWIDKAAGVPFTFSLGGAFNENQIALNQLDLRLADLTVKATDIVLRKGKLAARLETNRFDLASLAPIVTIARKYNPRGAVEVHTRLAIFEHKPALDGTVVLSKVNVAMPDRPTSPVSDLSGTIRMAGKTAHAGPVSLNVGSSHATLRADAQSIQPLHASYQLNIDTLKLGELVPSRQYLGEQLTQVAASGAFSRDDANNLAATANITSPSGTIANVAYQNLALTANYAPKLLTIDSLKLAAFGGSVGASGRATLDTVPRFDLKLSANQIDLQKALESQKAKAAETVRGNLTGNLQVFASGANFDAIRPTLRGVGAAKLDNGKLVGVNVVGQALKKVDNLPGIGALVPANVVANHPALFTSPDTAIDQASLTFTLLGPRITAHDIIARTADYTILGDGWFDMDKRIDVAARIVMSQAFSNELVAARSNIGYLENRDRQVEVPLLITGQLPKPAVLPDVTVLAQRAAGNAIVNKLGNLLGGKKSKEGSKGSKSSSPLDQLKGLFH
jgi:uncharacterized protein involved in outer membrane biogenesis